MRVGGSAAIEPSNCSTGSGRRACTWYSAGARWVWRSRCQMLAAAAPLTTPLWSMGMLGVYATAAEFDHAGAQRVQAPQVEFGVAVDAADPPGLRRRQHTVGTDD